MKKFYKNIFYAVLIILGFFFTSNIYAQEEVDLKKTYTSCTSLSNTGVGVEEDEYNAGYSNCVTVSAAAVNTLLSIDPSVVGGETYGKILESPNIELDMKRGIYGMATESVYAMYVNQPYVNVYAHLAEEWVPGYQQNAGIYAAEFDRGYKELTDAGITGVWSVARNISYVFFIIIMIIVGFMIMFRSKLGGQTLVTLGNSLPNVVIALIGVTFSFAIAGIIIDLGGVIMAILVDIFNNLGTDGSVRLNSFGALFNAIMPKALLNEIGVAFENLAEASGESLFKAFAISGISGIVSVFLAQSVGLITVLISIVVLGIATVGIIKVFITLVKAYLSILVNVITGPFQIAMSALPGKGVGFINWAKNIFRSVLVYPIVFAILNLPDVVYEASGGNLKLPGPDKLTVPADGPTVVNTGGEGLLNLGGILSGVIVFVVQILVIFAASKADQYAKSIIPPSTSKEAGNAAQEAKRALSGIPLVGSLLGK